MIAINKKLVRSATCNDCQHSHIFDSSWAHFRKNLSALLMFRTSRIFTYLPWAIILNELSNEMNFSKTNNMPPNTVMGFRRQINAVLICISDRMQNSYCAPRQHTASSLRGYNCEISMIGMFWN